MKIHSDTLTLADVRAAAKKAGVTFLNLAPVGSRSRKQAFDVALTGSSPFKAGIARNYDGAKAATWDEWGMFLAHLFTVDPAAHCGKNSYQGAEHFHWTTDNRFTCLTPHSQHTRHKWQPMELIERGFTARHGYSEAVCDCGAANRWTKYGETWEDIKDRVSA